METLFNYFWLLAIAVNGINAAIIWARAQRYIKQNPELQPGYITMLRGFFLGMSVPWIVMGMGITTGGVSKIADYFYPRIGNRFVIAWWVSLWVLILLYSYWIWFRGGAEMLIKHPGFLKGNPSNPRTIKLMSLVSVVSSAVVAVIMFSLEPR